MSQPWIRQVQEIVASKEIPLFGKIPSFPWEQFSQAFGKLFDLKGLEIRHKKSHWLSGEPLLSSFGKQPLTLQIRANLIKEPLYFVIAKEDLPLICNLFAKQEMTLQEGFYNYLSLEALHLLNQNPYRKVWKEMSLSLSDPVPLPKENCLCIDLQIGQGENSFFARVICPESFRIALKQMAKEDLKLSSLALTQSLPVTLSLTVGHTIISLGDIKSLSVGDCLVVEECSYSLKNKSGELLLSIQNHPLFHALFKPGKLEIETYVLYHEESPMSEKPISDSSSESDAHLWSEEQETSQTEKIVAAAKVPITVQIEIGRVEMTLEKLLALKPGNTLELPRSPEEGVHLLVNGRRIGRGDLVQLGESLGVVISELGE